MADLVDLSEIPADWLLEYAQLRLANERRQSEEAIARASALLDKPALGHYRRLLREAS